MNKLKIATLFVFALLLITSCSTARHRVKAVESLYDIPSIASPISYLSAKTELKMSGGDKDDDEKLNGTLKVSKGVGTVLAVTVAGMYEVARLEALPGELTLINKWDKVYTPILYDDILALEKSGVNYSMFESIMTNTIFSHDGKTGVAAVLDMTMDDMGEYIYLTTKKIKRAQYRFVVQKSSGNLVRTEILYNGVKVTECIYDDFKYIDDRYLPRSIEFVVGIDKISEERASMLIELSKIKTKEFKMKRTNLNKNYEEVDVRKFFEVAEESL